MKTLPLNNAAICGFTCLLGLAWSLAAFYPGILTNDSVTQWKMATGQFSFGDWHPPVMSALWRLFLNVVPGPAGMLIFQTVLFWSGLFLTSLACRPFARAYWSTLVPLVGFLPCSMGMLGMIWKDISMGAALVMGFGLISYGRSYSQNAVLYLALPFLGYAAIVRHNGMLPVFPLLAWAAYGVLSPRLGSRRAWHCGASGLMAGGVIFLFGLSGKAVSYGMRARHEYPYQYQMVGDLSSISTAVNQSYFPPYLNNAPHFRFEELRQRFGRESLDSLFWGDNPMFTLSFDPGEIAQLEAAWRRAILQHFRIYFSHKLKNFVLSLALDFRQENFPLLRGDGLGEAGPTFRRTSISTNTRYFFWSSRNSIYFRPGYWLALSLFFLAVGVIRPPQENSRQLALALQASAVLYGVSYFMFSPLDNFRFVWWSVIASLVGAVLWILPRPIGPGRSV